MATSRLERGGWFQDGVARTSEGNPAGRRLSQAKELSSGSEGGLSSSHPQHLLSPSRASGAQNGAGKESAETNREKITWKGRNLRLENRQHKNLKVKGTNTDKSKKLKLIK